MLCYNKEGSCNIIFTSNKHPSKWKANFNEDDALLCALDRIFDDAIVFKVALMVKKYLDSNPTKF